jgi:serine protease Do
MKKRVHIILILFATLFQVKIAVSQSKVVPKSTTSDQITYAINKAYPSCIKLFAYDTIANQQAGPQFSGVVVTKDGYILTVAHTTIPGKIYKVNFPDGNQAIAKALGNIILTETPNLPDVSLMKIITRGDWPFAKMGNSDKLKVNQPCIGISYPETLSQNFPTVRYGVITSTATEQNMIRSTCKMEPGDSGGPLFDFDGNVIGLHSAIELDENVNFDVPVNLYRQYWSALNEIITYNAFPSSIENTDGLKIIETDHIQKGHEININSKAVNKANQTTVIITSIVKGIKRQILGSVFQPNKRIKHIYAAYVISKNSEVGEDAIVLFRDGKRIVAKVISRNKKFDLVLLGIKGHFSDSLKWEDLSDNLQDTLFTGKPLFCVNGKQKVISGIAGSTIFTSPKKSSLAFLGAFINANQKPFYVTNVVDFSPAFIAGIKQGDIITAIDGQAMDNPEDFGSKLITYWPGDATNFELLRSGQKLKFKVILGAWPTHISDHPADHFAGGKSARRDGFEQVFANDCNIKSNEAGSPLFDYKGSFVGINIARFSRTTTLAIPRNIILRFISVTVK